MRRRLFAVAAAVPVVAGVVEVWRRGFAAPVLYGVRAWCSATRPTAQTEADPVA